VYLSRVFCRRLAYTRIILYYACTYYGYRYVVIYALHLSTHKTPSVRRYFTRAYIIILYYIIIVIITISSRSCRCRDDASPPISRVMVTSFFLATVCFFFANFFPPFPYVVVCAVFSLYGLPIYIFIHGHTSVSWASADRLIPRTEISCTARATSCLLYYIQVLIIYYCVLYTRWPQFGKRISTTSARVLWVRSESFLDFFHRRYDATDGTFGNK